MDPSISIFSAIIAFAVAVSATVVETVRSISSWKRHYVGSIPLRRFHFQDEVRRIYEKNTAIPFTDKMCTTLVVYIKNNWIQFFNPADNLLLMQFRFPGLSECQDKLGISEDGLTFFSRDEISGHIVVSTLCGKKKSILPIKSSDVNGYFNTIKYSLSTCGYHNKFCFNKSFDKFAVFYNGFYQCVSGEQQQRTENGKTKLVIHNTFTGSIYREFEIDVFGLYTMQFSDDGVYIAVITETSTIMIYNIHTGMFVRSIYVKCAYPQSCFSKNISWSSDNNKIVLSIPKFYYNELDSSEVICLTNVFSKTVSAKKIVIYNNQDCVSIGNWNQRNDSVCFYAGNIIYTFNFDTNVLSEKTIQEEVSRKIQQICFATDNLLVVVSEVSEPDGFKDVTYVPARRENEPSDGDIPYVDVVAC